MSLFYNLRYFCEELAIPWNSIMGKLYQRHLSVNCRSSRLQMFFKIDVLKNSVNFTWKYLCWSLFLLKLQAFRSATLLKRDSNTGVLLGKFARFLRTLFLQITFDGCFWSCSLRQKIVQTRNMFVTEILVKFRFGEVIFLNIFGPPASAGRVL